MGCERRAVAAGRHGSAKYSQVLGEVVLGDVEVEKTRGV